MTDILKNRQYDEAKVRGSLNTKINLLKLDFDPATINNLNVEDLSDYIFLKNIEKQPVKVKKDLLNNLKVLLGTYYKVFPSSQYRQNIIALSKMPEAITYQIDVMALHDFMIQNKEKLI